MASTKRVAEESGVQPKKSKQMKLDSRLSLARTCKTLALAAFKTPVRNSTPETLVRNSTPKTQVRNSTPENLVRNSSPKTLVRNSTPETPALVRNSSQRSTGSARNLSRVFSQRSFSQESAPESASTQFDIKKISEDPEKQRQYLIHHMVAQRQLHNLGLDVGPGGLPVHRGGEVKAEPLSVQHCLDIWTCLDTEEEKRELGRELDEGWLEACSLTKKFINVKTFLPAAAIHKILNEGIIKHPQSLVREEVFSALCYCLQTHPPGPNNRIVSEVYLEMMSHSTPHLDNWEFSATEPWHFLSSLLEICCQEKEEEESYDLEPSGAALGLEFLVLICQTDLQNYLDQNIAQNELAGDYKPLLTRILCPSDSLSWSASMKQMCKLYSRALAQKVPALPSLRTLVGLTAQLLQLKERTGNFNSKKVEMAKFLASELLPLELCEADLWAQLYLLEPAWLAALVSRKMITLATNLKLQPLSLRPLITNFIDGAEEKSGVVQVENANNNGEEPETKPTAKSGISTS